MSARECGGAEARECVDVIARGRAGVTVLVSRSTDPERNFALERELMEGEGDHVLLYIDRECVVVGRNQSAEAEVDTAWCAAEGVPMLRRITGGGAVWHDEGNVNFAFISSVGGAEKDAEAIGANAVNGAEETCAECVAPTPLDDRPTWAVVAALGLLGIGARVGPRGELTVDGWKVSGTASCVRGGRRLFHGTLLVDADLGRMARALAGDAARRGRKVASVPSPTANLFDLCPHLRGTDNGSGAGTAFSPRTTEATTAERHAATRVFMEQMADCLAQAIGTT